MTSTKGRPRTRNPEEEQLRAERLQSCRRQSGLSAADIADRLGINVGRYKQWERSFGGAPLEQYGLAIAKLLGIEVGWLRDGEGPPPAGLPINPDVAPRAILRGEATLPLQRAPLALRAKERRRSLGLSRTQAARRIGVSSAILSLWEKELPARHRGEKEDRWEDVLQVPRGWLRDETKQASPPVASIREVDLGAINPSSVSDEIRAVAAWLTHWKLHGVPTLHFESLSTSNRKLANYFAERYGVLGEESSTLQSIGTRYGLTRERIRQVQEKMLDRSAHARFKTPQLDALGQRIEEAVPISIDEFDQHHRALLGEQLSVESAIRFAREVLGRGIGRITAPPVGPVAKQINRMLVGEEGLTPLRAVRSAALKMIASCGAAHLLFVTGAASEILGSGVSVSETRQSLKALRNFEWLIEDEGWFWLGPEPFNRALAVARKVLAVAGQKMDVEVLHQAVTRSRRLNYDEARDSYPIELPWQVLREVLARTPWLKAIQKNDFDLTDGTTAEQELGETESLIYALMKKHGGIIARNILFEDLVKPGKVGTQNMQLILSQSPLIAKLEFGVFALRGVPIDSSALTMARLRVGGLAQGKAKQLAKADENGNLRFEIVISDYAFQQSVLDLPASIVRAIPAGEYRLAGIVGTGTTTIGKTPSAPCRALRLVRLLKKAGIQAGDQLQVEIDPRAMVMSISRAK